MARKRKTKKDVPITEFYEVEVEGWEMYYHFGINKTSKDFVAGAYWEFSHLILTGKMISPVLEKANKARIQIDYDLHMDDHWQPKPTIISAKAIGRMEIPRGDDTLRFYCSVPARSFPYISIAAQSGKIKYSLIFGTKLKWRQGSISSVSLSTQREEF